MMFRAEKMTKLNILLLARHVTETTRILGKAGLVHLVDATTQSSSKLLQGAVTGGADQRLAEAQNLLDQLMRAMDIQAEEAENAKKTQSAETEMTLEEVTTLLNKISARYVEHADAIDELLKNAGLEDRRLTIVKQYPLQSVSLEALHSLSRFYMTTGRLAPEMLPRAVLTLGDKALVIPAGEEEDGRILVLASNREKTKVKEQLSKLGFEEFAIPEDEDEQKQDSSETAALLADKLGEKLAVLQSEMMTHRRAILQLSEQYGPVLMLLQIRLHEISAILEAQRHFGKASTLYCISGWAPTTALPAIREIVARTTDGSGVIEETAADDDEAVKAGRENVPVKLQGGAFAKAFQLLVCNFGIPNYHEVDPTIFVGLSFTIFFGYMFGDVGQGLVLFLAGLWLFRSKSQKLPAVAKQSGPLLIACGLSAILFGFAYGSVFGCESIFHQLWVNPLKEKDIMRLLVTAVGIGAVVSSVAVIINIVNHFLSKKYFEGTFDRFGILGLLFYWIVLGTGIALVSGVSFHLWMLIPILLPLVLLALRAPIHAIMAARRGEEGEGGLINTVLECGLDVMETVTGYMSGTVSFVRIGAFAISHAALCLAVYSIVKMFVSVPAGGLCSLIVIILGNALIIAFEGMVAMIQAVRLEYYELFGKFYGGDGVEYKPFRVNQEETKN